jgi:hypothetical protein
LAEHDDPEYGAASPLTWLLAEESHRDRQLEYALFLSFTLDLGFFEAMALGPVRASGARVTVVGDARMSQPDPRAVRQAGRAYTAGLADCAGAFHPKLVVLAGQQRCLVAVGSGNTTLSGWQNSAELWTAFHGTPEGAPRAVAEVANWIRNLPKHVRLSRGISESLFSAAAQLDSFPAEGGPRVLGNLDRPLLEQLPDGPVDELRVFAPFHDPHAAALRSLVERLEPASLKVAVQPGRTIVDGPALSRLLDEIDGELVIDDEDRYRHGKLIEWSSGGKTFALTGSANLSSAALRQTPASGGNCELAVLSEIPRSIMVRGRVASLEEAAHDRFTVRAARAAGPVLLGATKIDGGVCVELARPLPRAGWLEISHAHLSPDQWDRSEDVESGPLETVVPGEIAAGSRFRVVATDNSGARTTSAVVFVVDPLQAMRRPAHAETSQRTATPDDLLRNSALIAQFMADLASLRASMTNLSISVPAAITSIRDAAASQSADTWRSYLDRCTGILGASLVRFALGQHIQEDQSEPGTTNPWAESLDGDDQEPGLEDDTAEQLVDENEVDTNEHAQADLTHADPAQRRRFRRWGTELSSAVEGLGPVEQLLATRLLLSVVALGAWDRDDLEWFPLVSRAVTTLGRSDAPPQDLEAQFGSLTAVGLALLRMHAPRHEQTETALRYGEAARAIEHLLPAAEPDLVTEYADLLTGRFGGLVDADSVQALADEVVQADPIADAVLALNEQSREAHADHPRVLHVTGNPGNPAIAALDAIAAAHELVVAAWARNDKGRWALLLWSNPDLYRVEPDKSGVVLWRHYRLNRRVSPPALARSRDFDLADKVARLALSQPIPEAADLIRTLGMDPAAVPACSVE